MTHLEQILHAIGDSATLPAAEALNDLLSHETDEHLPDEVGRWFAEQGRKLRSRRQRAERRHRAIERKHYARAPVGPDDEVEFWDLVSALGKTEFGTDALLALAGVHPDFASFGELAGSGQFGSRSNAYRMKHELDKRLAAQDVATRR